MIARRPLLVAALVAGAVLVPISQRASAAAAPSPSAPSVSRYMVVADSALGQAGAASAVAATGGHVIRSFSHAIHGFSADLTPGAAAAIAQRPGVRSVQPNHVFHPTVTTESNATWGLDRIDQSSLPLDHEYNYTDDGSGVTAYVLDTGITAPPGEFTGRLNIGYDATGLSSTDDACIGHGTHVSGTIGSTTWGVAKGVSITPVRVFNCISDTTSETIVAGLDWIVADHQSGDPAVLNMSIGGPDDAAVNAASTRAVDDGIFVAVAAGNEDSNACLDSPASALGVVTVGATDRTDARAEFSNFGTCVDLFAPGVEVTSTSNTLGFATYSGTSMASPHVAGAAARFLSAHPTATPGEVATALLGEATTGVLTDAGTGSPDRLLFMDPTDSTPVPSADNVDPSVPANVTAEGRDYGTARVSWDASSDNVGVLGYQVFRDGSSQPVGTTRTTEFIDSDALLAPNTTYSYTVEAVDRDGNASALSTAADATTSAFAPMAPVLVIERDGSVVLLEMIDPNAPGVVSTIEVYRNGDLLHTITPDGEFFFGDSDFGLLPGQTYTYAVRSIDKWGSAGPYGSASVTIPADHAPPSTPSAVHGTAASATRVHLRWNPSHDDADVAGYRVYRDGKLVRTAGPFASSIDDTGLHGDTLYHYAVRAFDTSHNLSGSGTTSVRTQPPLDGYWMLGQDGGVFAFNAGYYGADSSVLGARHPGAAAIGSRADGRGYWIVDAIGRVFAHGSAKPHGDAVMASGEVPIAIVGSASGNGYWIATNRGRVLAFGDAPQHGPARSTAFHHPIVGMARTPSGAGYWLVGSDGGIFSFGDAHFYGSTGGHVLHKPIVGMSRTPSGRGYWLVASDGGIFTFGDAHFYGSAGSLHLAKPIIGMVAAPGGHGYWLSASDGGVFSYGNAPFRGSLGGHALVAPIVGLAGR